MTANAPSGGESGRQTAGGFPAAAFNLQALWESGLAALIDQRVALNRLAATHPAHGDELLAAWQTIGQALPQQPDESDSAWLGRAASLLAAQTANPAAQAYAAALEGLARQFAAGKLNRAVVADLARRVVAPQEGQRALRQGQGLLGNLLSRLGESPAVRQTARRYGLGERFWNSLATIRASKDAGQASLRLILEASPLRESPYRESGEVVVRLLFEALVRQAKA